LDADVTKTKLVSDVESYWSGPVHKILNVALRFGVIAVNQNK
jgi:hypothetical protein